MQLGPHRPLWQTLLIGSGLIGLALLGAFILYLATMPLLWWRDDYCHSLSPSQDKAACVLYYPRPRQ
jgi:hypothetical protein